MTRAEQARTTQRSYRAAGVDYDDARRGQAPGDGRGARHLAAARWRSGGRALDASRGEPAFVFELDGRTLAFVVEGLGTKSIIARQVLERQGINRFADVAYDTVAAILNDLCCVGALPLVVNAYFATGASEWYASPSAPRRCWRAGSARASTRAARGAGGSRRRCRGCSTSGTSSWRARRWVRCPRAARRSSASELRRGRRDRARRLQRPARQRRLAGATAGRAAARRLRDRAAERDDARRGAAGAVGDVRAAGRGAAARASSRSPTSAT